MIFSNLLSNASHLIKIIHHALSQEKRQDCFFLFYSISMSN